MNDFEKARILDALVENHAAILGLYAQERIAGRVARRITGEPRPPCGCDPDVGYFCQECAEEALISQLIQIQELYARLSQARVPVPPPDP